MPTDLAVEPEWVRGLDHELNLVPTGTFRVVSRGKCGVGRLTLTGVPENGTMPLSNPPLDAHGLPKDD